MSARLKKIVTAGEVLADVLAGVAYAGGAPANVACAAARLGSGALVLGRVGGDARARTILDTLAGAGVSLAGVQVDASAPTRGVIVESDAAGGRSFAGFDGTPPFADELLDADSIDAAQLHAAAWFACGSPALASVRSRAAIVRCLEYCDIDTVPVAVDVNRRDIFWRDPQVSRALIEAILLPQTVLLKAAREEALWLFGSADPTRICAALPRAQLVVVTHGEQGGTYATRTASGAWPAFDVACVDATGAGDAFLGALLHALDVTEIDDEERLNAAVVAASAAGALATRAAGALSAQPSSVVLRAFLGERNPQIVDGDAR